MTIGVFVEDAGDADRQRIVQRPYSVASDPGVAGTEGYEMYVRLVEGGLFTPLLWRLPVGHRMRMIGPKGKFTLEPDDDRTHLFISSGTGNAPFVSMMKATAPRGRGRGRPCSSTACRTRGDLGYRDAARGLGARRRLSGHVHPDGLAARRRPRTPAGRAGRAASRRSSAPVCDELGLTPDNSIAYICGNPDMILAAEETLLGRGFPEEQVKKELYWPKGKEPTGGGTSTDE